MADFLALGVCEAVFGFGTVIVLLIDAGGICLATTKKRMAAYRQNSPTDYAFCIVFW